MPFKPLATKPPLAERFWSRVDKTQTDGCWIYTGPKNHNGYGSFSNGRGSPIRAHRLAFVLTTGSIPEGMDVCHRCDTPACVNPDHLWLGDRSANMRDCATKRRLSPRSLVNLKHRRA